MLLKQVITTSVLTLLLGSSFQDTQASQTFDGLSVVDLMPSECVIYPSIEADVGSHSAGVLEELAVDVSDRVGHGDIIARLDSSAEKAAVDLAMARANKAAEISYRQLSAEYSNRKLNRLYELDQLGSVSKQDYDDRKTETALSGFQLLKAQESRRVLELELVRAEDTLDRRSIKSPFAGVVLERYKTVGEYVDIDPVVRIAQLDPLHVETILPAKHMGRVDAGMLATIVSDTVPGAQWVAYVDRVDSVIDIASGTFGVRLILPNPEFKIMAGLRCQLTFSADGETVAQVARDVELVDNDYSEYEVYKQNTGRSLATVFQKKYTPTLGAAAGVVSTPNAPLEDDCVSHGPYQHVDEARRIQRELKTRNVNTSLKENNQTQRVGDLVVSPNFENRKAAKIYKKNLAELGYPDSYILAKKSAIQVAIGAFRRQGAAEAVILDLQEQGVSTIRSPWEILQQQYYLVTEEQRLAGETCEKSSRKL